MKRLYRNTAVRILIAEDHASTRLGVKAILKADFPRLQFGQAGDAEAALALIAAQPWDLLILDITLPGHSGVELLAELKRTHPDLPVLVYSAHREEDFALHMLKAGATGYLTKERAPEELSYAVAQVLHGGTYLSRGISHLLVGTDRRKLPLKPHEGLSAREFQVLRLIAAGKSGKEAAAELGLSDKTISTFRTRILRKLHAHSTAELIKYAVRERLI